jgi:2',3'-cyclic-nucleotide 2'-phosphodiesterase/3'-nucleotidase/5'-nucleotidase
MQDSVIAGVHFVQPDPWAQAVSVAHVWLVRQQAGQAGQAGTVRWRVARIQADLVSLANVPPSPALERRFALSREAVRKWVATPLATLRGDWSPRLARAEDTPVIDFVNEVQRRQTGAQLSSTAAFDIQAGFGPDVVRMRDVAGIYPYENTLKAIRIDGARLKAYLEQSAQYFRSYRAGAPIINDSMPGFNFDIVSGVTYSIDLSQPVGSRILQLAYRGRLVQSTDTFTLALNNYRQGGGGGFRMLAGLPVVYDRNESIRDLVVEAARKADTLRASDYNDHSWRITPEAAAAAVRSVFAGPPAVARDSLVLRILTTNDIHGALEPQTPPWSQGRRVGGIGAIKGMFDALSAECRCPTLRLDGGDEFQGTPVSNWFFGRPVVEAMNAIGYDAAVVGNHEYDWGIDTLRARIRQSRYRWLTANTTVRQGGAVPEWTRPWEMVEKAGHKIALIGITTSTTPIETKPSNVATLVFSDEAAAVRKFLPGIRQAGAELVVVIAHAGGFCNPACAGSIFNMARQLDSGTVDLIVSAHSHSEINTRVNGIPIVQARSHGTNLAVVDWIRLRSGRNELRPRILTVWTDSVRVDSSLVRMVEGYSRQAAQLASRPVAKIKLPLLKKEGDYPLGHLIADAQRLVARADVAIMNNGGIRAGLPAGSVSYGQVYEVQPLDNRIVKLTVPGDALLRALEHGLSGGRLNANVSGVEVWYDPTRPDGKKIRRTKMADGREIEKGKTYTLAVVDFLAQGGSGFSMLMGLPLEQTGVSDVDAVLNYLRRLPSPIEIPDAPRIQPER